MAIVKEHELHKRRYGRNKGVGLLLVALVAVVFGLTVAKVKGLDVTGAYDASDPVAEETSQ